MDQCLLCGLVAETVVLSAIITAVFRGQCLLCGLVAETVAVCSVLRVCQGSTLALRLGCEASGMPRVEGAMQVELGGPEGCTGARGKAVVGCDMEPPIPNKPGLRP